MLKEKKELIRTYNISKIAKTMKLPEVLIDKIFELEPVYQESRYPDVSSTIPAEEFEKADAEKFIKIAAETLQWIKKRMN